MVGPAPRTIRPFSLLLAGDGKKASLRCSAWCVWHYFFVMMARHESQLWIRLLYLFRSERSQYVDSFTQTSFSTKRNRKDIIGMIKGRTMWWQSEAIHLDMSIYLFYGFEIWSYRSRKHFITMTAGPKRQGGAGQIARAGHIFWGRQTLYFCRR